jgi:hypothetical protein
VAGVIVRWRDVEISTMIVTVESLVPGLTMWRVPSAGFARGAVCSRVLPEIVPPTRSVPARLAVTPGVEAEIVTLA